MSQKKGDHDKLISELKRNKQKVNLLENTFQFLIEEFQLTQELLHSSTKNKQEVLENLFQNLMDELTFTTEQVKSLDSGLQTVIDELFQEGSKSNLRELLVQVTNLSLTLWEENTKTTKIELAEKSKIWSVVLDKSVLRTRTFDRYLTLISLPERPRWRDILRTARYVLNNCPEPKKQHSYLEKTMGNLQQLIFESR